MKTEFLRLVEMGINCRIATMSSAGAPYGHIRSTVPDGIKILYEAMGIDEKQIDQALAVLDKDLEDLVKEFLAWQYGFEPKPRWLKAGFES